MANSSQEGDMLVQQGPYRQTFKLQTSNDANLRSISVRTNMSSMPRKIQRQIRDAPSENWLSGLISNPESHKRSLTL
ncbi:hypothetical protein CapIbe_011104 [Capra ibex]